MRREAARARVRGLPDLTRSSDSDSLILSYFGVTSRLHQHPWMVRNILSNKFAFESEGVQLAVGRVS